MLKKSPVNVGEGYLYKSFGQTSAIEPALLVHHLSVKILSEWV
ncbi:hypothetical protein DYBT9275_05891 [Dyadobacter sp. CECT 9275]|uniref:Uncharacterized protein n=1 Tax=Dyadobacter helix TaxID=2822344 RepID=A0A916JJT2_9BACT|nr:hypothetical protein DYBT9275_05891 [Dyadobacter sp. CECT 9275]